MDDLPHIIASDKIRALWPVFFQQNHLGKDQAEIALPADTVDLIPFCEDIVSGEAARTWPGRSKNLNEHFLKLLPEFVGQPRIAHLLACCIVTIRKTDGAGPGMALFFRIIQEHDDLVFPSLNSRWLTSVADTLADHGQNPTQSVLGLCGSILANTVKLAETERQLFSVPRPWPPKGRLRSGGVLFDGVIPFWGKNGDMIDNLLARIESTSSKDKTGGHLLAEIMGRMLLYDTVYRRSWALRDAPQTTKVPAEVRARLKRITNKYL